MSPQSEREMLPAVRPGKGVMVQFLVNDSLPSDSPQSRRIQTTYDGQPDSLLFEVPTHWHKYHDELWTVLEGRMQATVGGKTFEVKAGDETVRIPRGVYHGMKAIKGERLVFSESAEPPGAYKEAFIRDMLETQQPGFFHAMRVMYDGDTYPALGGPYVLDQVFVTIFGGIAKFFAPGKAKDANTVAPRKSKGI